MDMVKRVIFSVGFSIIMGLTAGYYFEKEVYYFWNMALKNEVTKKEYLRNTNDSDYAKEVVFNTEKALATGFGSLGICLVISSIVSKKRKS